MLNLTPHEIVLSTTAGVLRIPPSGMVARVATIEQGGGWLAEGVDGHPTADPGCEGGWGMGGDMLIPVVRRSLGQVEGLPEEGKECLVSSVVLAAVPGRRGVYAPDTGPTAIRDERGQIIAVTRLIAA